MNHIKPFNNFINENKPKGAPDFHHSSKKVPKAEGRFRDLSIKDLAAWLIKTRDKDLKRISGALTQQITFNKNDDPEYAEKMEKTRKEVYKQLGRDDLLNEYNKYTGNEVAQYIKDITPDESDIPDYFINKYIKPNNDWELKQIKLKELLKDRDFRDYYNSGEERYDEYSVDPNDLYNDLVVYKGKLLDGYSRAAKMLRSGEKIAGAYVLEKFTNSIIIEGVADGLLNDVDDDNSIFDIDIEVEDENGRTLDDDPEETGDFPDERARPPRQTKKQRAANAVKSKVSREWLGPDSKLRPVINKIFKKIEMEIKKEASKQGVPISNINLDKISIKR